MRIRVLPHNIPFVESLITFLNLFPLDNVIYGIMSESLNTPQDFRTHLQQTYGYGSRAAWIRMFEWALDTHSILEMKERMHQAMSSAGYILRYRTFIRDYQVFILKPEDEDIPPTSCFSFLCTK